MLHEWLLLILSPAVLCALLEGFSRGSFSMAFFGGSPVAFALTLALWAGLCMVISVCKSARLRYLFTLALGLAASLVGIANRYKMRYRVEPVLFTDLYQLGDAAQTVRHLEFSINLRELALVLFAFVALSSLCMLMVHAKRQKRRVILPVLGLMVIAAVTPLCTFERVTARTRYDLVDAARTDGTLYTALAVENQRRALMRVDYTEQDVREQYRSLKPGTEQAAEETPNIILILSESFTSERWLADYMSFTREITPFYNRLVSTCQSGSLYVPKVGGGTSETEFEVLTGLRSQYAINPYAMGLPPMNSMASVLRDQGYASAAIHWYSGVYYNRYNNLRRLGFTDFFTTDTTQAPFASKGMFVCDEAHYNAALSQLRRTEERDFVFVLTMQNHGGYAYDDFRQRYGADEPFTGDYSAQTQLILSNHLWLMQQSDRALEAFLTELSALPEETIVVFFGDHIAPFGESVYQELGVDLTGENAHLTPYFIWSNRENTAVQRDLYAWQLGAEALRFARMDTDPFLSYTASLCAPGDALHDLLSYDALFGSQYAYDEAGLAPETPVLRIGGEMTLHGFDAAVIADAVYVKPQLAISAQKYALSINGQCYGTQWVSAGTGELDLACVMKGFSGETWNESNALHFENAQALLDQSGTWLYTVQEVDGFACVQSKWSKAFKLWKSNDPFPSSACTALTADGVRWTQQPVYGLTQPGQYALDADGYLWLAVRRGQTPDTLGNIELYLFE